uniref:RNA helicase n=1 Tax=Callorhinchus milii TaxID=7868 RepID=A0A4W3JZ85_CALMI
QFKKEQCWSGTISGRLTAKKLQDLYGALQNFSFKTEHIEEAMKNTVIYGGDLHSALDWLCLNLPDDLLPDGFSLKLQEDEEEKTKAKSKTMQKSPVEPAIKSQVSEATAHKDKPQAQVKSILSFRLMLISFFTFLEQNELYLELVAKLQDVKERALTFKQNNNRQAQREAGDRIKILQREMKQLETHPAFERSTKIQEVKIPNKSSTSQPLDSKTKNAPKDVRNFDYNARSWTGKSPKQFLIDWCRKNYPISPAPSYRKIPAGRFWKSSVRVHREKDGILEVCPTILTEDSMQAQHLASTLALWHLVRGQNSLCGYQIRMESKVGESCRLLYCTTGILLRKLQQDQLLSTVSHVIVDEVHERSVHSDFLLIILKEIMQKRLDLNLVLMSATVDSGKFANYFAHCPIISIPGRLYPVEVFHLEDVVEATGYTLEQDSEYCQRFLEEEEEEIKVSVGGKGGKTFQHQVSTGVTYLEDYSMRTRHATVYMNPNKINMELILEVLHFLDINAQYSALSGAVLIFLPGLAHIQQLHDHLTADKRFQDRRRYKVIALHSILSSQDQAAAFTVPPPGVRKIVLATNIAETGITIPDVVFVIDSGKTKENRYRESSQMSSLVETFVSKANALQRQGRAGRVQEGFCFRLYTKERFHSFIDYSVPEILRVPLEELCLHIMKCNHGSPEEFLSKALDPPQAQSIGNAMNLLKKIGACEINEAKLTPLGLHLAALPVNVKIGKMLIFGAIFGCLDPVATIAAAMTEKSPFVTPLSRKDEANLAKASMAIANSDHLTLYNAYLGWKNARHTSYRTEMAYCKQHFLSRTALLTMQDIKQELIRLVEIAGFVAPGARGAKHHSWDRESSVGVPKKNLSQQEISLLKAVLAAGLYDNVGKIKYTPSVDITDKIACSVETAQGKAHLHPSSVNKDLQSNGWLLFQEKVKYGKIYLRETTEISSFPILLFGGDILVQHHKRLLLVDGWIKFQAPVRTGIIFKELRALIDSVLTKKLEDPKLFLEDDQIIQTIVQLIQTEHTN